MNEQEKLKELREIREGMKYGTMEEGIPQLTEDELFLLKYIDKLESGLSK